jgi:AcrR family transcriptional regulator
MTDRKGYHHGNLRQALIDAALALIGERGAGGVSFAEAARRAGVSPTAPYRHFRDRDDLLAETARRGFERFGDRLEAAWSGGRPTPLRAFEAVGRAYLAFAREEPAYFTAMFEAGVHEAADAGLRAAGDRAFGVLLAACAALAAQAPPERRPPAHMMAYHVWSLAHGVAALFGRDGAARPCPIDPDELLEAGAAVYLRGLGLIPPAG